MRFLKNIFLSLVCGGYFFMSFTGVSAFLGEDLGLNIYKNIDEGLFELETKQYEYEISGQGEASIQQVVGQILSEEGVECNIETTKQIEEIIAGPNPIGVIRLACFDGQEIIPSEKIATIQNRLSEIKTVFSQRAENKSKKIYEIARIGLYSDGSAENSPFDLIVDLQEIDRVIFSEEISYEGEPFPLGDSALQDFLTEDKSYLQERREQDEDEENEEDEENPIINEEDEDTPIINEDDENEDDDGHVYACFPEDESGLDDGELDDLDDYVYIPRTRDPRGDIPIIEDGYEIITDDEYSNGRSWGGPFPGVSPNGQYAGVSDAWACDSFFCIVIDISIKNQNLLGGSQTTSIESILTKANEHLDKFANTSLVQSKMTQNNFELGLVIPNLSELLRGFGIQVQTKPAPILNNIEQSEQKKKQVEGDIYTSKNLLSQYYKNIGLDYERRNDLDIHENRVYTKKILQECSELSINCPVNKLRELEKFQAALAKSNEEVSLSIDKKALSEDTGDFYKQFVELERFVGAIDDFATSMSGMIKAMKKIPTRKS